MTDRYQFRPGTRIPRVVKPEVVARELEKIRERHGALRPKDVVAAARSQRSALHPVFEWDDGKAGTQYRLFQARQLTRAIQIIRPDEEPQAVYSFVPSVDQAEGEYDRTEDIAEHVDRYALALAEALRYLRSAQERVEELKRAAGEHGEDKVAAITLAAQALVTAQQAIRTLQ